MISGLFYVFTLQSFCFSVFSFVFFFHILNASISVMMLHRMSCSFFLFNEYFYGWSNRIWKEERLLCLDNHILLTAHNSRRMASTLTLLILYSWFSHQPPARRTRLAEIMAHTLSNLHLYYKFIYEYMNRPHCLAIATYKWFLECSSICGLMTVWRRWQPFRMHVQMAWMYLKWDFVSLIRGECTEWREEMRYKCTRSIIICWCWWHVQ